MSIRSRPHFLVFALLTSVLAGAPIFAANLPSLRYADVGANRLVKKTKFYQVYLSAVNPAADQSARDLPASRYRAQDLIDANAIARAIENIETRVEPRLERLFARLPSAPAWRAAFPIRVNLQLGLSPIHASASKNIEIGDEADDARADAWSQILTHETGHVIAGRFGVLNEFHQEFWADFFAWAVYDREPRMYRGFAEAGRAVIEPLLRSPEPETRATARIQLELIEGDAVRVLEGPTNLREMYREPERYRISVELNRLLQRLARATSSELLAITGLDILREHGAELGTDVFDLAALFRGPIGDAAVDAALAADGLRPPLPPPRSVRERLTTQPIDRGARFIVSGAPDSKPILSLFAGKRFLFALAPTATESARVEVRLESPCAPDEFNQRVEPGEPLSFESVSLDADGILRKERIALTFPRLPRNMRPGSCWIARSPIGDQTGP